MRRLLFLCVLFIAIFGISAQDITLPKPAAKAGVDVLAAIVNRNVTKDFLLREVSLADLSTMLWAGLGRRGVDAVTSATKAGRNISFSGENVYINAYLLSAEGVWKYDGDKHLLARISSGDQRTTVSRATSPNAAFMILFTVDNALTPSFLKTNPGLFLQMANATAGFAAQNISLTAGALGLSTVIQYTLAAPAAATVAKLGKDEVPLFILQGGYAK